MSERAQYKYDVFISYSHNDQEWVRSELLSRLEQAGLRVCIDHRDFEIGVPSLVNMEQAVDNSHHTLVVLTPAWIKSEWTEFESLLVGAADPAARRRKVIPLLLKACKPPSRIAMLTYADFTQPSERETQMVRLVKSISTQLKADASPPIIEQDQQPLKLENQPLVLPTNVTAAINPIITPPKGFVMKCFSWLHLTDLHQGMKEQHWLWPGIKESFFEDLKRLHDKCGPWDLVLFTGDLTQQGSAEEFQKFDELLSQLWEHFKKMGSFPTLLAVPGNHDLIRPNTKNPSVQLLLQWNNQQDIQTEFWDNVKSPYRRVVTQAFKNYLAWWEKQLFKAKDLKAGLLPGDFSVSIEKDGVKLGIVGLNTAFLQLAGGDYEGKLALHARQFHEACGGDGPQWAKQHQACLLLTHHPPGWLSLASQQHLKGEITDHGRFAVHLCGHLHEVVYRDISEGGTEAQRILQGRSLFGLEFFGEEKKDQRSHGYTAGKIELHENKGTLMFWPREARLQGAQRSIVPDYSLALTDNQHTNPTDFKLLQSYASRDMAVERVNKGLTALESLMQAPEARDAVVEFQADFRAAHEQINVVGDNKDLHDLLHELEFQCYSLIVKEVEYFPDDKRARDNLEEYERTLQSIVIRLRKIGSRTSIATNETSWIQDLNQAQQELLRAIENLDTERLKKVVWRIDRVLALQPTRINTRLNDAARALRLPALEKAMARLRDKLDSPYLDSEKLHQFKTGVDNLASLNHDLTTLIRAIT